MELGVPTDDLDVALERAVATARAIGSPGEWDEEWQRRRQRRFIERAYDPAGVGARSRRWSPHPTGPRRSHGLDVPTLVIHGDTDPLIDVSGGRRTAELVPGAELLVIEGMGHDLPPFYWSPIVEATTQLVISTL